MLLWLLAACSNDIIAQYEAEKAAALEEPPGIGAKWDPDLRIRLSDGALDALTTAVVGSGLTAASKKLEIKVPGGVSATLVPEVVVSEVKLRASKACDGCLAVTLGLDGDGAWSVAGKSGSVPLSAKLGAVLAFAAEPDGDGFALTGALRDVTDLEVTVDKVANVDLGPALDGWVSGALAKAPQAKLGRIGGEGMPLRGVRLQAADGGLSLEAITDVPNGAELRGEAAALTDGWDVALSEASALSLMRRAAFQVGIIDKEYNIAADPRSLSLKGDLFTLGLRLWRLEDAGWWRDYTVKGKISRTSKQLRLVPAEASEGETSEGAGVADPLAVLGEGIILDAVAGALAVALPANHGANLADLRVGLSIEGVTGADGAVVVRGALTAPPAKRETTKSGSAKSGSSDASGDTEGKPEKKSTSSDRTKSRSR